MYVYFQLFVYPRIQSIDEPYSTPKYIDKDLRLIMSIINVSVTFIVEQILKNEFLQINVSYINSSPRCCLACRKFSFMPDVIRFLLIS